MICKRLVSRRHVDPPDTIPANEHTCNHLAAQPCASPECTPCCGRCTL